MAKRYSKLPTELLPPGTVPKSHLLSFNVNVAMLGAVSEHNAQNAQHEGPIRSRADARAAIEIARADWHEMERMK